MRVLIADGGTGGHIFPALAVADELMRRGKENAVLFTGTPAGLESDIVPRHHYDLKLIHVGGLIGKGWLKRLRTLMQLPFAYMESRKILREFSPELAIGFGAYPSGPVLMAAHRNRIPILLVEPNAIPGFTNRLLLKYADRIAVPYPDHQGVYAGKAVVTGTPARPLKVEKIARSKCTIGIFGGSQGARAINESILQTLPRLAGMREKLHLIHQTGKADFERIRERYNEIAPFFEVIAFVYDVEEFYNRCDFLICRAGAITLAEITSIGKPAILVPLPTATHNHQEQNARRLAETGAAKMILQKDLTSETLLQEIEKMISSPDELARMAEASKAMGRPEAVRNIVDLGLSIVSSYHDG